MLKLAVTCFENDAMVGWSHNKSGLSSVPTNFSRWASIKMARTESNPKFKNSMSVLISAFSIPNSLAMIVLRKSVSSLSVNEFIDSIDVAKIADSKLRSEV